MDYMMDESMRIWELIFMRRGQHVSCPMLLWVIPLCSHSHLLQTLVPQNIMHDNRHGDLMLLCIGRKQHIKKRYELYITFWIHLLTSAALTSSTKSYPGSSSGKDSLNSCRIDVSLKFRQLCNAQQIQCTKARSMGKQEGRGSMHMISNLSKYNWTMSHTPNDHVHLYLQCLHVSVYGNCLWKHQSQK